MCSIPSILGPSVCFRGLLYIFFIVSEKQNYLQKSVSLDIFVINYKVYKIKFSPFLASDL